MFSLGSILFDEPWQVLQLIGVPSDDLRFGSRRYFMFVQLLGVHSRLKALKASDDIFVRLE